MKKNSILILTTLIIFIFGAVIFIPGCIQREKANLTFMVNFQPNEVITEVFEEVINKFNSEHNDIQIEFIPGNPAYEDILKAKMAANQLPDMWATHGWSVARYSDYLIPLEDEKWVPNLHPAIKPIITDELGHVYVLPLDVDISGIAYNKEVIERAGINIEEIKTWSDLLEAMGKIKEIGVIPLHIAGKDNWTIGNFFDWIAPSYYITDSNNYKGDELKNGKFDKETWEKLAKVLKEMQEKGYINVDVLTAKWPDISRALATGETAFAFFGNYVILNAWLVNPDADLGFFPIPAFYPGDEPSMISGERTTVGIWKDSKYPEQAKEFLTYLAQPEIMAKLASANGVPAGLTNVKSDMGKLTMDYQKWSDIPAHPFFDREFLPNGMWDVMCLTGNGVLAGDMSPEDAADKMNIEFNKLYKRK